ncbi:dynactin p62 family-domain-containing protein [Cladochytrium replicatum]|nr:dynactin p62 family-domain-containing protein [Cladochytrium replicatum]
MQVLDVDAGPPDQVRPTLNAHSIYRLYYCTDCHQLRCPVCVQEEIVVYYCPNCLFEVPTASVKSEKNRCARNCFECPICQHTLSVVSVQDPTWGGGRESPTTDRRSSPASPFGTTANVHYLSCGVCRWDSLEVGLKFERPTGLAMQLQKTEEDRPDVKEFEHLREHFEKVFRANSGSSYGRGLGNQANPLLSNIPGLSNLPYMNRSNSGSLSNRAEQKFEAYESITEPPRSTTEDNGELEDLRMEAVTTLDQRLFQLEDQPRLRSQLKPQRIQLRTKRQKRCRGCEHVLIKPEPKPQLTNFKIKLVAIDFLPNITIAPPHVQWPINGTKPVEVAFRFTNPLEQEIAVALTAQPETIAADTPWDVTLMAPNFTVGPYNVMWEYEEQQQRGLIGFSSGTNANFGVGIQEKRRNYTIVLVKIARKDLEAAPVTLNQIEACVTRAASNNKTIVDSFWVTIILKKPE